MKKFLEVETKYEVDGKLLYKFKKLVEGLPGVKEFIYAESNDIYYTKDNEFIRYRFSTFKGDKCFELTYKKKINEANNIFREEVNLKVNNNTLETVDAFVRALGYRRNFTIQKYCHLYKFDMVVLPFYTVFDENENIRHFMEIEINESKLEQLTKEECWNIIEDYEKKLKPLGISAKKRIPDSLFEMYKN